MKRPSVVLQSLMLCVTSSFGCAFALAQSSSGTGGWYTTSQAANGAKAYQKACASCHGANLQGGMAPTLVGKQFWLTYGGKKVSTLWSDVHTQMPMICTWLGLRQKLDRHHGISFAEKWRARGFHAAQRYGGFVQGASVEIVESLCVRRSKKFKSGHKTRPTISRCCELLGGSDAHR